MKVLIVNGYGGAVDIQGPSIGRAFRRLGWSADFWAYQSGIQIRRVYQRYDYFNFATFVPPANRVLNRMLVARCRKTRPDLLFVTKGETLLPGVVTEIGALGITTAHWSTDDPLGRHHPTNRIANLREYGWVFTWDMDPARILRDEGLRAFYLPDAAPEVFTPDPRIARDLPLTFIGQYSRKREETLKPLVPLGLRLWGNGWYDCKSRALRRHHSRAFSREGKLVELYRRSVVTVNPHDVQAFECTNFRTFEALACGTLPLTEHNPEIANLFEIGREIVTYGSVPDLAEKARHFLARPEEALGIAERGRLRVDREHRMFHRIAAAVRIVREGRFDRGMPLDAEPRSRKTSPASDRSGTAAGS